MTSKSAKGNGDSRVLHERWTKQVIDAGYTVIPSVLLERQQAFALDAIDINILLHIIRHWWKPDEQPFPSRKTIATCMGVHVRTVQRRIAKMESDGLIQRRERRHKTYGRQSNYYDLSGLVKELGPYANELLAEKKKNAEEKKARIKRKSVKKTS